jgi:glutathione synthase/RimK-type ligase-like ATP-grasp enzyme
MIDILVKQKYKKKNKKLGYVQSSAYRLFRELSCRGVGAYIRTQLQPISNNKILLNWGRRTLPEDSYKYEAILNHPDNIQNASDKLICLEKLNEAGIPALDYTIFKDEAAEMIDNGGAVFCRTKLSSNSGKGIVIATTKEELVPALLYTEYFPHNKEYRYHVFNGEVILVQEKRKMGEEKLKEKGIDCPNKLIKNHNKGYVLARKDVTIHSEIVDYAIQSLKELLLDFGALDILVEESDDNELISFAICEVNTAPALVNSTIKDYADAIEKYIGEINE